MSDAMHSSANFRLAAMDLARRFSSLQLYVSAANELIARCERLQPRDISRHSRKLIALVEIARQTLTRFGLRLYQFAACPPALSQHKSRYFDMLRLVKSLRQYMDFTDVELRGRIDRLLLPLSSNLRIPAVTEDTAAPFSCRSNAALSSPPQSPMCIASTSAGHSKHAAGYLASRGQRGSDVPGKMLPPDVLMARSHRRRVHRVRLIDATLFRSPSLSRRPAQNVAVRHIIDKAANENGEDAPRQVIPSQPRRKFGIFCTQGPGQRRANGSGR